MTDLLTAAQVAELIGVKVSTVYKHLQRKTIPEPSQRFGFVPVWEKSEIEKWRGM